MTSQSATIIIENDRVKVLLSGPYCVPRWLRKASMTGAKGRLFVIPTNQFPDAKVHKAHQTATIDAVVLGLKNAGLNPNVYDYTTD